ncbi:hypothetical protein SeMB42_g06263 [Synchytrium endobioticum]|nr:hypothetical protein SeMB42_g06266 [Synchytrium endobioticum]TPX39748.1 hypothetical protein SeMB42_g06263 [Synchytrium endobioticum]
MPDNPMPHQRNASLSPAKSATSSPDRASGTGAGSGSRIGNSAMAHSPPPPQPNQQHSRLPKSSSTDQALALRDGGIVNDVFICPICNEVMVSLAQLNQHLDDSHYDDDPVAAVTAWFRKTQRQIINPLQNFTKTATVPLSKSVSSLNLNFNSILPSPVAAAVGVSDANRLELNTNAATSHNPVTGHSSAPPIANQGASSSSTSHGNARVVTPAVASTMVVKLPEGKPPEMSITRNHWQKESLYDICSFPECKKQLTSTATGGIPLQSMYRKHHCRKCGRIYCEAHSCYQMKVAADARHDPVNGIWCRVCEICYKERDGYTEPLGAMRNRTGLFNTFRRGRVDKISLDVNKLEKRLDKLVRTYVDGASATGTLALTRSLRSTKSMDQSVVAWQNDRSVLNCPLCGSTFNSLKNRRHHCRLCGRVICGLDACSSIVSLYESMASPQMTTHSTSSVLGNGHVGHSGSSHSEDGQSDQGSSFGSGSGKPEVVVGEVRVCRDCRRLVFRRREQILEDSNPSPVMKICQAIARYRGFIEELLPKFNILVVNMAARQVNPDDRDYQLALRYRKNLLDYFSQLDALATAQYMQANMFTLHMLPKVFKDSAIPTRNLNGLVGNGNDLSKMKVLTAAERAELCSLKESLGVLSEQISQVEVFIADATRKRRFEDASSLRESWEELKREAERIRIRISELESPSRSNK